MNKTVHFKLLLVIAVLLVTVIASCKKDKNLVSANATIVDSGPTSLDGCGWLVKIEDNTLYHVTNLEDVYKENNMQVVITYHLLTTQYRCTNLVSFSSVNTPTQIELISIRKK